jgi:hypothetical protein
VLVCEIFVPVVHGVCVWQNLWCSLAFEPRCSGYMKVVHLFVKAVTFYLFTLRVGSIIDQTLNLRLRVCVL